MSVGKCLKSYERFRFCATLDCAGNMGQGFGNLELFSSKVIIARSAYYVPLAHQEPASVRPAAAAAACAVSPAR